MTLAGRDCTGKGEYRRCKKEGGVKKDKPKHTFGEGITSHDQKKNAKKKVTTPQSNKTVKGGLHQYPRTRKKGEGGGLGEKKNSRRKGRSTAEEVWEGSA